MHDRLGITSISLLWCASLLAFVSGRIMIIIMIPTCLYHHQPVSNVLLFRTTKSYNVDIFILGMIQIHKMITVVVTNPFPPISN